MLQLFQALFFALWHIRSVLWQVPVGTHTNFSILKFQDVTGRNFLDRLECADRIENVAEIQVLQQGCLVDLSQFRRDRQNRFNFRTKVQAAIRQRIVQRFFAEPVAGQEQGLLSRVVKSERKHASQFLDALRSVLLVKVDDDLSIAVRIKFVPTPFEVRA